MDIITESKSTVSYSPVGIGLLLPEASASPSFIFSSLTCFTQPFSPIISTGLDKFMKLIEGFGIDKDLKIKECSKGMKEKIQIALSLSRKSKVYILDEPMSGIDPKSRKVILQTIIDNFDYEGILLISTHLIGEIEKVLDRAIFIDQAKIIVNERVDDIREKKNMGVEEYFTEVI